MTADLGGPESPPSSTCPDPALLHVPSGLAPARSPVAATTRCSGPASRLCCLASWQLRRLVTSPAVPVLPCPTRSRFPSCPSCIPSHPLAGSSPSAYAGCSVVPQGSMLGPLLSSRSVLFPVDGVSVTPMVSVVICIQMASKPSSQGHTLLPTQLIKPTGLSPFQLGFLRGTSRYRQYPSASSCRRAPLTFTKLGLAPPPTVLPARRPAASSLVPLALVPSITPFCQFNLQYIFVDPSTPQHSQRHHPRPSPYEISYLITPTFFESSHQ